MLLSQLDHLLNYFEVPMSSWGQGDAKTLGDLFSEIREGECYLRVDQSGLTRVVEIAKLHISQALYHSRGCLIEVSERLPGHDPVKRDDHPSETLRRGETAREAAIRGVCEELRVDACGISTIEVKSPQIESRPSESYPNLTCMYILHHTQLRLSNSIRICHEPEFETTEEGGLVHQWRWEKF